MGPGATFLWGAVGGAAGYLILFLVPWLKGLASGEVELDFSTGRVVGFLGLLLSYIALGGVAAILFGEATEAKHAIAYGLGFEGILKGTSSTS